MLSPINEGSMLNQRKAGLESPESKHAKKGSHLILNENRRASAVKDENKPIHIQVDISEPKFEDSHIKSNV